MGLMGFQVSVFRCWFSDLVATAKAADIFKTIRRTSDFSSSPLETACRILSQNSGDTRCCDFFSGLSLKSNFDLLKLSNYLFEFADVFNKG